MAYETRASTVVPPVRCPCGFGWCHIRESHTNKNPDRLYYKCKNELCDFFMWCDEFIADFSQCKSRCQCNGDEVMQKLVEENEKLRKRVHQLELQLEKKTQIAASLGRVISTLTTEENDG
ncbi:hypothetical protein Taro_054713 [Colocasia esculenta]|uniref:GRF-type domain-containing protein n=1 Tax=Colocasia esculenta TaxID=4460 RepID=A0A843XPL6_COLES|nr:hypothetical protein [Colocasia esculenta]